VRRLPGGVVHEDVQPPELARRLLDDRVAVGRLGQVARDRERLPAGCLDDARRLLRVAILLEVGDRDVGALARATARPVPLSPPVTSATRRATPETDAPGLVDIGSMLRRTPVRLALLLAVAAACALAVALSGRGAGSSSAPPALVPQPVSEQARSGSFALAAGTRIVAAGAAAPVGRYLHGLLAPATGFPLPVAASGSGLALSLGGPAAVGAEGYVLDVSGKRVTIQARTPAGLFHGVQTLRQLLPPAIESRAHQAGSWRIPAVHVLDYPRFAWRGAHLDVARHFFPVATVERYVDLLALYKLNTLHLHLSDDQGWRIAIDSWPRLASVGGSTEVGGGKGGFYTQAQYRQIVRYAAARFVTVVPEIDSPGHVNAALASYATLNCNGKATKLYTATNVGFSSLCIAKPVTYAFYDDVVRELAALSPGKYFDVGGDEAQSTTRADLATFLKKAQTIVGAHGKTVVGWVPGIEVGGLTQPAVGEYWNPAGGSADGTQSARAAVKQGMKLVMAPASVAYFDQKYDADTSLGLTWAGLVSVRTAYSWDPATFVTGVGEKDVLGVESALWSETLHTLRDIQYMTLPRLPGLAEIGWSPRTGRSWSEYRLRLATQAPRWRALGATYFRAPGIPWK
jgi:hexosaminidase